MQGLRFTATEPEFSRPYRLESTDGEYPRLIASGTLTHTGSDSQTTIRFDETFASELLLTVTDDRNPPLGIYSVVALSAVRQAVFDTAQTTSPVSVYYGAMNRAPPNYDFSDTLPPRPETQQSLVLTEQRPNPAYRAPEKPFTERAPWVVYVVLIAACLALFGVLRNLVRETGP